MMIELNLQNRFEITYDDVSSSYIFTTNKGVIYHIIFIDYTAILDLNTPVYMLTIERVIPDNCVIKSDAGVRNSILYIFKEFFKKNENAFLSIYDMTDKKHNVRKKLFDSWYKKFNTLGIERIEREVEISDCKTVASLFYSPKNKNISEITEAFNKIVALNFYCC